MDFTAKSGGVSLWFSNEELGDSVWGSPGRGGLSGLGESDGRWLRGRGYGYCVEGAVVQLTSAAALEPS